MSASISFKDYLHALILEHNLVSIFRFNFHRIDADAYRSAQPTPWQIKKMPQRYGIKTIVNLRGERNNSPLQRLEQQACDEAGIQLVNFDEIFSRDIPRPEELQNIKKMLETIEYPALFHCTSGSDRAGLVSTLYLHWIKQQPMESIQQLKFWPYGHIKYAKTGLLDYFIEQYIAYNKTKPIALMDWVKQVMDRMQLKEQFKTFSLANFLVDKILRRE